MSNTDRTTSRRRLIQSGGLAAIAAGLMGTAASTEAAVPLPTPTLATVVHTDDLAAECRRLSAEYHAALTDEMALYDQLQATLTDEQEVLLRRLGDAGSNTSVISTEFYVAEIARHIPKAGAVRLILANVDENELPPALVANAQIVRTARAS